MNYSTRRRLRPQCLASLTIVTTPSMYFTQPCPIQKYTLSYCCAHLWNVTKERVRDVECLLTYRLNALAVCFWVMWDTLLYEIIGIQFPEALIFCTLTSGVSQTPQFIFFCLFPFQIYVNLRYNLFGLFYTCNTSSEWIQ